MPHRPAFFSSVCIISPLEGHRRRSGGRRTSTPGRRDSVLSLACTLLAAGRRAQGAGGEGEVFAERVDEVCLHLTAGRSDQEAGGGAEGGEVGEGAVAGLSTLLFLLCGRMPLKSDSTRRSGGASFFCMQFLFCQVQENTRFCTELAAERRWTASYQERAGAVFFMRDLGRLITGRCIWTTCGSGPRSRIRHLGVPSGRFRLGVGGAEQARRGCRTGTVPSGHVG